jgi:adhesin transport system outer membrane protein
MKTKQWTIIAPGAALLCASPALAIDLQQAVQAALQTNPQIRQAISNRAATEEERVQAQGQYYPRVTVEGSVGLESLKNPTRRELGIANHTLHPAEGDLVVDQLVYDAGGREAEIRRQAARTDSAAARVQERSEYVALNVARNYIDYLLQQRLVAIAQDNASFHEKLASDLRQGVANGSISIADQQQAEERLQAARAKVTQAQEDLEAAGISFQTLTGVPIDSVTVPPDLSSCLPATLADGEAIARQDNPSVREAMADLAAAREEVTAAKALIGPKFSIQGRARVGNDIDGFEGITNDFQILGVAHWDIFTGGINQANIREQQNRANEAHGKLFEETRQAEDDVRTAWSKLQNQTALLSELEQQSHVSDDLLLSYREQFNIGRRSLLDVLDTQNTRYNVQEQTETARLAKLYAQYRVLAAENHLTQCLGVQVPAAAYSNSGVRYGVNPIPPADLEETSLPAPVMGPPAPIGVTPGGPLPGNPVPPPSGQ